MWMNATATHVAMEHLAMNRLSQIRKFHCQITLAIAQQDSSETTATPM
jgi:hypothetical protein